MKHTQNNAPVDVYTYAWIQQPMEADSANAHRRILTESSSVDVEVFLMVLASRSPHKVPNTGAAVLRLACSIIKF